MSLALSFKTHLNLKQPPCRFSKNVSSKERVKLWGFFVTFNIIISDIFPEYFFEIPQVVQKS